jgi:hypothetical protein
MYKLFIQLTIILIGCSERKQNPIIINLALNLGKVEINLPSEFDTLDTWILHSDFHCGDKQIYRLANSRYDIYKRTGDYDVHNSDSIFQFQIVHDAHIECVSNSLPIKKVNELMLKEAIIVNSDSKILSSEIARIKARDYAILETISVNDSKQIYNLLVTTLLKNSIPINFVFSCAKANCQDFIQKANNSLETIRIIE